MKQAKNHLLFIIIFAIAFVFRFWRLEERTLFSGEATAELVVLRDLASGKQSPLLGYAVAPYVKGLYTTPWFWYFLIPLFIATHGDPFPFIVLHPLIGIAGIYFLYKAGVISHSQKAGLFAAALYAGSMAIVNIDRSVWSISFILPMINVSLYMFARAWKHPTKKTFLLLGIPLGLLMSLHFVTLLFSSVISGVIFWKKRRFFLWALLPLMLSSVPLILFDITNQFSLSHTFVEAIRININGTKGYSTGYFFYQLYPPLILLGSILLTKLHWKINSGLLILFFLWQLRDFVSYQVSPNYKERKELMEQLLTFWERDRSVTIYLNDKPFFEYGYLFLFLGRNNRVTEDSVTTLTPDPKNKEQAFRLVRERSFPLEQMDKQDVDKLLEQKKAVLVLDEDKLKLLPYSSLTL